MEPMSIFVLPLCHTVLAYKKMRDSRHISTNVRIAFGFNARKALQNPVQGRHCGHFLLCPPRGCGILARHIKYSGSPIDFQEQRSKLPRPWT